MEDVPEASVTWDLARYATAALRLGQLNGQTLRDGLPAGAPPLAGGLRQVFALRTGADASRG